MASGADCTIVDLEDAVAVSAKERARAGAVSGISAAPKTGCLLGVRVNALATGLLPHDVTALGPVWPMLSFIMLPMVPDPDTVRTVAGVLADADEQAGTSPRGPRLIPLVETARGVLAAAAIASADPRVRTLAFGPADLSCELGVTPTAEGTELLYARSQVVLAAAAAGCEAPLDGPWLDIGDLDGLRRSAAAARDLGFAGKQVIHPGQIGPVLKMFSVSDDELAWASAVDAAFAAAQARGVASIRLPDGTFVDYPVARRARALLARARSS